ncbi:MAG: hypothetical protein ABIS50_23040 [Luteolibacter sp.]|uniref:hypothetical protein n=1 Tax=Luteolibacter sp. TaxID=1962973 RepID=UPI003265A699
MTPLSFTKREFTRPLLLAFIALIVGLCAITSQSLWMDEGSGAFKALMPNIRDWWTMTMRLGGSDTQMPVYMFLLWCWTKCGVLGEFALRCINLPWLILAVLALRKVRFWPLVCLTSPFVLYYTGELRPYAMQIAGGALAAAALGEIIEERGRQGYEGLHAAAGAGLLLAASSLTALVWASGFWLGILIIRPDWLAKKGFWLRSLPWIGGGLAVGGYYLFTLLKGFRAAGIEGGGGVLSVFFGFYEMLGLLGLGPGRNELRESPATVAPYLPILLAAFACIAGAWLCGVKSWLKTVPARCVVGVICAIVIPVLMLTVVGQLKDFRVLGRHLSPAIPALLLPIAAVFSAGGPSAKRLRVLGTLAVMFMAASSLELRFLERHARDDYRRATAIGIDALKNGKTVWWQADMNATRYYAYRMGGGQFVNAIQVFETNPPSSLLVADVVILNRPDLRYPGGNHRATLEHDSFKPVARFTGFEIWETGY